MACQRDYLRRSAETPPREIDKFSFDGDFAGDRADALAPVGRPFQAEVVSGFGQLKMPRRQIGGGPRMNRIGLCAVREIFPVAGGEDFRLAVHNFIDGGAKISARSARRSRAKENPSGTIASERIAMATTASTIRNPRREREPLRNGFEKYVFIPPPAFLSTT